MSITLGSRFLLFSTLLLTMGGLAAAETAQPLYTVSLSRDYHVGDRLFLEATGESTKTSELPMKDEPKVETTTVSISGELEVLEVRESGQAKRAQLTVKQFEGKVDGKAVTGIGEGDTLVVAAEGDTTVYRKQGSVIEGPLRDLLKLVFQYKTDEGPDDQAFFGTETPQPVGGSWPVDAKLAAETLTQEKMVVEARDVEGASRLDGVSVVEETPCMQVSGQMEIEDVEVEMPRMAKLTSSKFTVDMDGDYPVDTALPPLRVKTVFDLDMRFRGTGLLGGFRFGAHQTQVREQRLRLMERGAAPEDATAEATEEPAESSGDLPSGEETGWRVLRSE